MKKNIYDGGLFNPLNCEKANFSYEVEEIGKLENVNYPDEFGGTETYQERPVLLRAAGGFLVEERFYCTLCDKDALKPLRVGELISAKLHFEVKKKADGSYFQHIIAKEVFTLNDYFLIREATARHEGEIIGRKEETN